MVKGFNFPVDFVLYDLSYANLILYGATLPRYDRPKKKGEKKQEVINASDPRNRQEVQNFFKNVD